MNVIRDRLLHARKKSFKEKIEECFNCQDELLRQKTSFVYHNKTFDLERFDLFRKWLSDSGADVSVVEFGFIENIGCNGVKCTDAINESQVAFSVPRKCMIADEDATLGNHGPFIQTLASNDELLKRMPMLVLVLCLLEERRKGCQSSFAAYIDILPTDFGELPLFWTIDSYLSIEGSHPASVALERHYDALLYYTYLHALVGSHFESFSFEEFRWALACVMTRQNPLPRRSQPDIMGLAMIPLFDMCNHDPGVVTTDYDSVSEHLKCMAGRAYLKGEEFRIFYGPRTNTELLVYSGFVMDEGMNAYDSLFIDLMSHLSASDPLFKLKQKLVANMNPWTQVAPLSVDAWKVARLAVADKSDMGVILRATSETQSISKISDANELLACDWLKQQLIHFADMKRSQLGSNPRPILRRILLNEVALVQKSLNVLDS